MINTKQIEVMVNNIKSHITNSYLIYDDCGSSAIIDPGDEPDKIINAIQNLNIKLNYILITHAHADHIGAIEELYNKFKCKIVINEYDYDLLFDNNNNCAKLLNDMKINLRSIKEQDFIKVHDKEEINLGKMSFCFIHTPGHTKGSMCIYEKNTKCLFTGDTIFSKYFGRCDLFSASLGDMIDSLKKVFAAFDGNTQIFCGHGDNTTLKEANKRIKLLLAIKYNIEI